MSVVGGFFTLACVGIAVLLFALWRGDQVTAGVHVPGAQLFLSYRRNRRK